MLHFLFVSYPRRYSAFPCCYTVLCRVNWWHFSIQGSVFFFLTRAFRHSPSRGHVCINLVLILFSYALKWNVARVIKYNVKKWRERISYWVSFSNKLLLFGLFSWLSFPEIPIFLVETYVNPLTPVLAVTGRDELWPFLHFCRHHFWPKLASSTFNFCRKNRSFQWCLDQSDQPNGAWDMHKNAKRD